MSTTVRMTVIPKCDICGDSASYDARTYAGYWGYFCKYHFKRLCVGLGTGKGQRLVRTKTYQIARPGERGQRLFKQ